MNLRAEDAALPEYNAEEIVRLVNLSMALRTKTELNGMLRKGDIAAPLNFRMEEGLQSTVNRVNITGNDKTKPNVIRRELAVAPGDN